MRESFRDLRDAARSLLRRPGFTVAAILTLALGVGATTSVFTVAWRVLLRPLPYAGSDALVTVFTTEAGAAQLRNPSSPANYLDLRAGSETLEGWTTARAWSPTLTEPKTGPAEQVPAILATPGLFELLGARAALGAAFRAAGEPADERVVVLSHGLWRRRFGGDPEVVGRTLRLDGEPYAVLGVMPPGFEFPPYWATGAELWAPLVFTPEDAASRGASYLRIFARLTPGRSLAEARGELEARMASLAAAHPEENRHLGVLVEPLHEPVVSPARRPVGVLLGAVGLVLLAACANVAGLFLARALDREGELAVRAALGAGAGHLMRRVLAESVLVAAVGGLAGSILAAAVVEALRGSAGGAVPRLAEIRLDGTVVAFAVAVSLLAALLAGLGPALRAARRDPERALRRGSRSTPGRPDRVWRPLVVAQVALAVVLLTGAGLLARSLVALLTQDPGFRTEGVLTASLPLGASERAAGERRQPFLGQVLDRVAAVPGVEAAALVNHLPIGGDLWNGDVEVAGRPELDPPPKAVLRTVTPGYFETLGIRRVAGRGFDGSERPDGEPVVVVNQALAALLPDGSDPVGGRIRFAFSEDDPWRRVVGVVGDARQDRLHEPDRPEVYFPYPQDPFPWYDETTLVARTAAEPREALPAVQEAVWAVDPAVPVVRARSLEEVLAEDLAAARFLAALMAAFAATAVALAAVGLFGLLSFLAGRRRREIGVRMALGAGRGRILALLLRQGAALTGAGLALGLAGAYAATRALSGLLYGVPATDAPSFAAGAAALAAVAALACYLPARRATAVDPAEVIRAE